MLWLTKDNWCIATSYTRKSDGSLAELRTMGSRRTNMATPIDNLVMTNETLVWAGIIDASRIIYWSIPAYLQGSHDARSERLRKTKMRILSLVYSLPAEDRFDAFWLASGFPYSDYYTDDIALCGPDPFEIRTHQYVGYTKYYTLNQLRFK
jgi:hypothetical protein